MNPPTRETAPSLLNRLRTTVKLLSLNFAMFVDRLLNRHPLVLDLEEITFVPYLLPIVKSLYSRDTSVSFYIATNRLYFDAPELEDFKVPRRKRFHYSLSKRLPATKLFLSPHIHGQGHPNAIRVNTFHNQPIKWNTFPAKDFVNYDVHFLVSPLSRKMIEQTIERHDLQNHPHTLLEIGFPKSDSLLSGRVKRGEQLDKLRLNPDLPTVLYAPSYDEGLSLRTMGEEVIETMLSLKINLLVKLHPVSYTPPDHPFFDMYTGGINWRERLAHFEDHERFFHIISQGEIDPFLSVSDVLVTDVSSVALEYILLDKPIVYIDCPEFFERVLREKYGGFGCDHGAHMKDDPTVNGGRHVGVVAHDTNELKQSILNSLARPEELSARRQEFAQELVFNPGNASEVAAKAVEKLLTDRPA